MKGSQSGLQVGGVGLEVIESASNAGLKLGWLLAGWARGRDLVEGAHLVVVVGREVRDFAKR